MMTKNESLISGGMTRTKCGSESKMAAIMKRLNAIGDNPLCRNEVAELRRAYTAAVVRYFDDGRTANATKGEH